MIYSERLFRQLPPSVAYKVCRGCVEDDGERAVIHIVRYVVGVGAGDKGVSSSRVADSVYLLVRIRRPEQKPEPGLRAYCITVRVCMPVDYYSGYVYSLLGIENDLFTPLFAISRTAGWVSHHLENRQSNRKLIRPANVYVGEMEENE